MKRERENYFYYNIDISNEPNIRKTANFESEIEIPTWPILRIMHHDLNVNDFKENLWLIYRTVKEYSKYQKIMDINQKETILWLMVHKQLQVLPWELVYLIGKDYILNGVGNFRWK